MDTIEHMAIELGQRADALRVLAAKIDDAESQDAIVQWAGDYEQLQSALWKWLRSQASMSEEKHGLRMQEAERHSETTEYRALIAEFRRLLNEMQAWRGAFDEECEFIKQLERITRLRFAQSRPFLRML